MSIRFCKCYVLSIDINKIVSATLSDKEYNNNKKDNNLTWKIIVLKYKEHGHILEGWNFYVFDA